MNMHKWRDMPGGKPKCRVKGCRWRARANGYCLECNAEAKGGRYRTRVRRAMEALDRITEGGM